MQEDLTRTRYERVLEDRNRLEDAYDRALQDADRDCLTGLFNKRGLERRVGTREWGWWVVADLDGFKRAQDSHPAGHEHGDAVLCEFAEFLRDSVRGGDVVASRKGGDEFMLWIESKDGARRVKEAIRAWRSSGGDVTASAGMGRTPPEADAACFLDKREKLRTAEGGST